MVEKIDKKIFAKIPRTDCTASEAIPIPSAYDEYSASGSISRSIDLIHLSDLQREDGGGNNSDNGSSQEKHQEICSEVRFCDKKFA